MPTVKTTIQQLVNELADEVRALLKARGDKSVVKARPPATAPEIAAYEAYVQLTLPPMYRSFLELHNGYDWLLIYGPMLSVEEVMPGGAKHDFIIDWKKTSAEDGSGDALGAVVIGQKIAASPSFMVYLNPDKKGPDGEWAVVDDMVDVSKDYPNLAVFFEKQIAVCQGARKKASGSK